MIAKPKPKSQPTTTASFLSRVLLPPQVSMRFPVQYSRQGPVPAVPSGGLSILSGAEGTNAESAIFGAVYGHEFNDPATAAAARHSEANTAGETRIVLV